MPNRQPLLLIAGLLTAVSIVATPTIAAAQAAPATASAVQGATSSRLAQPTPDRWDAADNVLLELSATIKDGDNASFARWIQSFGIKLPSAIKTAEFLELGQEVADGKVVTTAISQLYLKKSGKSGHLYKFSVAYVEGQEPTATLVNQEYLGNWGLNPGPLRFGFKDAAPVLSKFIKEQTGSEQTPTEVTLRHPVSEREMSPPLIIWGIGEERQRQYFKFDSLSGAVSAMRG